MTSVHQLVPSFVSRDAVGAHTIRVQQVLRGMGLDSEIYAADIGPKVGAKARHYRTLSRRKGDPDSWLLYQLSTGNRMADWLLQRPERKLVNYHNMTPAELLHRWNPSVGAEIGQGRRQLQRLAPHVEMAIAVSEFNRDELVAAGYERTEVVPLFSELGGQESGAGGSVLPSPSAARTSGHGGRVGARWLFVGRIVPNKCQHDLVKALAAYRRIYDPSAELVLVGKPTFGNYAEAVTALAGELGVAEAVHVRGSLTPAELTAEYHAADVVVCLSEHEGYWAVGLEAMAHGVPVVAYAAAAVPETVLGAGLVLPQKGATYVAAAVHRVLQDEALRGRLVACGRARAVERSSERSAERFRTVVARVLSG